MFEDYFSFRRLLIMQIRWVRSLFTLVILGLALIAEAQVPDFVALSEKSSPSVVNISTTRVVKGGAVAPRFSGPGADQFNDMLQQFFGQQMPQIPDHTAESLGTGFFVSDNGYVLTNYHVIREADTIVVGVNGGDEYEAKIIGMDPTSDLALLKIEIKTKTPFLEFGSSDNLKVGEWVMAIGSPFGFEYSVTQGIVSAIGRGLDNDRYVPFIQTDVAINPGSSGGPLLNYEGKVVGINSQIVSRTGGYLGLSFAIPSDLAKDVLKQLKTLGKVKRGYLGVAFQNIDKNLAQSFNLAHAKGALVAQVLPDSPADKAGLKDGDIIVSFEGQPIESASDLPHLVGFTAPGTSVKLGILRKGQPLTLSAEVGELPAQEEHHATAADEAMRVPNILGLGLRELTPDEKRITELKMGLLLAYVAPNSPASMAGLRPGDVIFTVNQQPVNTLDDFKSILTSIKPGMTVPVLMVRRGVGQRYVALKVLAEQK
jgi:serine protease Do